MVVFLNGNYIPMDEAKISVNDRGFMFGDGVYEVIRVVNGNCFREKEHFERLKEGIDSLRLKMEKNLFSNIRTVFNELINRNHLADGEATLYLQITRGAAWPRTHPYPEPEVEPTIYVMAGPFKAYKKLQEKGIGVITLPDVRWQRCNLKTVNLLPNVMARQEASQAGVNSAIMIRDGLVTESPNANIFGVQKGVLRTYPANNLILRGITRDWVIETVDRLGIEILYDPIREEELLEIDELFFTGTTTDIQPVVKINRYKVGNGKPGPVTKKIQNAYNENLYQTVNMNFKNDFESTN